MQAAISGSKHQGCTNVSFHEQVLAFGYYYFTSLNVHVNFAPHHVTYSGITQHLQKVHECVNGF